MTKERLKYLLFDYITGVLSKGDVFILIESQSELFKNKDSIKIIEELDALSELNEESDILDGIEAMLGST